MGPSRRAFKRKKEEESDLEDSEYEMEENYDEVEEDESDVGATDEYEDMNQDEDDDEGGESSGDDEHAGLGDLEKEYHDLDRQESVILENLKREKDEDRLKGQAVKNQKALWDKNLEFRFLLQKPFSSSNKLPSDQVRASFCHMDEEVVESYADLISSSEKTLESLLELQEALLEKNPSVPKSTNASAKSGSSSANHSKDSKNKEIVDDEEWLRISQMYRRLSGFRDKSIDKWQRKTLVTSGVAAIKGRLQAFNQNISEQVAAYMRDPSRMVKQMQQQRPTVGVFGPVLEGTDKTTVEGLNDGDPELLDDTEFYQQLLKEFFETIDPNSSESAFYALKRSQTRKRKVVDRRASKSRKIRYNVHEKIVNFMAPEPMKIPEMASKLFENLFGLRTQKSGTVV